MPSLESATVTLWTGVGSRYEANRIAGISHFAEHIVFKGSKKRPSAHAISQAVDSFGGEFNAGTSKEWTNYYIKARTGNIDISFDVLSDMVLNPIIKQEDIDKERGVILEEMAMYEDTPMMKVVEVFEETIFAGNELGRDTIGTREAVKSVNREDFLKYRRDHYSAKNMLLTVAGGVKHAGIVDLAKKYLSSISSNTKTKPNKFKSDQKAPQLKLVKKKNEQIHLILGFRGNPLGHKDRYVESVLSTILGGGMSSRMFIEVREKRGLAYSVRTDAEHYTDAGYLATYAGVDPKKAPEAIKVILEQYYKIKDNPEISERELKKAKEYLKGHFALALENTTAVNRYFGEQELLEDKIETPEEAYAQVDKVTLDDITRVAKEFFVPERLNLSLIGPYNTQAEFEKVVNQ